MKVDLTARRALLLGPAGALVRAIEAALKENGATVEMTDGDAAAPDLLVVCHDLDADTADDPAGLIALTEKLGRAMATRGQGRIVVVTSALGALPARRHSARSAASGAVVTAMRTLAMQLGPNIQVNAVGAGAIAEDESFMSGSEPMLAHATIAGPGTIEDIVHAVLFLADPMNSYMTGQTLAVDGGWSAGYGRNF